MHKYMFDDMPHLESHHQSGKSFIVVFEGKEETAFFRADQITSVEMAQLVVDDREKPVRGSDIHLEDGRKFLVREHPGLVLTLAMKS
jgi:hypothetical protein